MSLASFSPAGPTGFASGSSPRSVASASESLSVPSTRVRRALRDPRTFSTR